MVTFNLFGISRIVVTRSKTLLKRSFIHVPGKIISKSVHLNVENMSQKSITSFFNRSPKSLKAKKNEFPQSALSSSSPPSDDTSPANGITKTAERSRSSNSDKNSEVENSPIKSSEKTAKRSRSSSSDKNSEVENSPIKSSEKTAKRSRSSSSDKNSEVENSPIKNSEKKKKIKRQRIQSSDSEPDTSPVLHTDDKTEVKVELSEKPKIITSSKIKKTLPKIKVEKKTPSPKKTVNNDVKTKNFTNYFFKVGKKGSDNETNDVEKGTTKTGEHEDHIVAEEDYNPAKAKYHPINDACWSKGQEVPYLALAKTLEAIEATSARLKMVEILSNYFRSVIALTPEDLLPSIYLSLNQLAPAYHNMELGIAETYLLKAVARCTGRAPAQLRADARRVGDLGRVAESARAAQRVMLAARPLAARRVLAALRDVAAMTGQAAVNKKIAKIQALYVACRHCEARYLIRSLEGKLRVGLAEQSLLQALAAAAAATPPAGERVGALDVARDMSAESFKALVDEYALIVKTTYCECPNYELVVPALLRHGVRELPQHCRLTPGIPLKPMLAQPARGVREVLARLDGAAFTCEWKYDGERAQLHVPGDDGGPRLAAARLYSRNQEDHTSKYPDILERLPELLDDSVTSCVLDCEVVAYDTVNEQILPFQVLSTRKRKVAAAADVKVQVCVFLFDLLYLNGRALVREPLEERRRLLRAHFREAAGRWQRAAGGDCADEPALQHLLEEALRGCCEGLMVKALRGERARYDIARRSHNWLKLKKDYLDGVGDTVDAVVIGAYRGRGRRAGVFGGFLLACYDPATENYQSLCRLGTGFSDEELRALTAELQAHVIDGPRPYYMFDAAHAADVWLGAAAVWEVRCADLSLSPAHRAALGLAAPDRGVSLRFPRFVRARADKAPEQATSAEQVARLYAAQDQVKSAPAHQRPDRDDFY